MLMDTMHAMMGFMDCRGYLEGSNFRMDKVNINNDIFVSQSLSGCPHIFKPKFPL